MHLVGAADMVLTTGTISRGFRLTEKKCVKKLEPQAFDIELQSSQEPFLVAFLKHNERFRDQSNILNETIKRYGDKVHCYLYDEDYLDTAMDRFRVKGTPTFLLFSEGREVDRLMGESDRETLDDFIKNSIPDK